MKKEEFIALGISEELAEKVAEASKTELGGYVPKTRFDEVNESKKALETSATEYQTQLEDLKKSTGDNEAMKKQIEDLQADNKKKEDEHKEQLKDLQLTNAIKVAINGKAQDNDLVSSLIDKSKLILGEDGAVTGLDEQIKILSESKAFLFKEDKQDGNNKKAGFNVGANQQQTPAGGQQGQTSMKDAIAAKLQTQIG